MVEVGVGVEVGVELRLEINFHGGGWVAGLLENKAISVEVEVEAELGNILEC